MPAGSNSDGEAERRFVRFACSILTSVSLPQTTRSSTTGPQTPTPSIEPLPVCRSTTAALLVLHHLQECPVAEIAAVLGSPEGTIKSRLHRARAALESALAKESR
jgi:RNA polymerase sigma-70 factor (ECF subfamily)